MEIFPSGGERAAKHFLRYVFDLFKSVCVDAEQPLNHTERGVHQKAVYRRVLCTCNGSPPPHFSN